MLFRGLFLLLLGFQHTYGWYDELFWWLLQRNVCYDGYGCFSNEYPFTNSEGFLPESPESLGVRLLLYTRNNRHVPSVTTEELRENLNSSKEIKVIIHGYKNSIRNKWVTKMKDAFLQKDDFNVFILDWEEGASSFSYHQSVANARLVAAMTTKQLENMLETYGIDPTSIHIVGFSLGAHVAGYIGNALPGLDRITGLDPAGPNFDGKSKEVRLDPGDATFVDVIHTDADNLFNIDLSPAFGAIQPMGHADFYVNGGQNQPGCPTTINQHMIHILRGNFDPFRNFGCSHLRAVDIFTESINSECKFTSTPCAQLPMVPCNNNAKNNFMGYHAIRTSIGTFRTNTANKSPFCLS